MRKQVGLAVLVGVVLACGDDAAEEAGEMLRDAGEALADAGMMLSDAGGRDAQAQTDAGASGGGGGGGVVLETVNVPCSIELTQRQQSSSGAYVEVTRWYAELNVANVISVTGCGFRVIPEGPKPICTPPLGSGITCTGTPPPTPLSTVCGSGVDFELGGGKARFHCGEQTYRSSDATTYGARVASVRAVVVR